MAGFDPSVISSIPDGAGNPQQAQQNAYTLYDSKNKVELNSLNLSQAKEEQSDRLAIKKIAQGSDLSTDRGKNEFLEKASKVSPDMAMKYQKDIANQKGMDLDNELKKLTVAQEQVQPIIGSIDSTLSDLQQRKELYDKGQITKADLDSSTQREILPKIMSLKMDHPELAQYLDQFVKNPQNLTYSGLVAAETQTKDGRDRAKTRTDEIKTAQAQQKIDQNQTRLEQGDKRLEGYLSSIASQNNKRDKDEAAKDSSRLSEDDAKDIAQQYLAGDKSVITGLGRSAENIAAVRKAIRSESEKNGITPADRAAKIAEYNGFLAEERRLGTSQANIESAANEAAKVIPIALDASNAVPRTKWVPINKIIQAGKVATSDKALAKFGQANLTLANVYSRAMNPNGAATVSGRDHALEMLGTATSQDAYKGVAEILAQEIDAAKSAPPEIRKRIFEQISKGKATHESIMEDLFPEDAKTAGGVPKRPGQQTSGAGPKGLTPSKAPAKPPTDDELINRYQ